jgi:hypothetical protein
MQQTMDCIDAEAHRALAGGSHPLSDFPTAYMILDHGYTFYIDPSPPVSAPHSDQPEAP